MIPTPMTLRVIGWGGIKDDINTLSKGRNTLSMPPEGSQRDDDEEARQVARVEEIHNQDALREQALEQTEGLREVRSSPMLRRPPDYRLPTAPERLAEDAEDSAAAFEAAQEKLNEAKANEQNAREARTLGDDEKEAYRQALDAYEAAGQEQREAYGRAVAAYGSENALHEALSGGDPNLGGSAAPAEGLATTSSPIDAMKEAYKNAPTIAKPSRASHRRTQTGDGDHDHNFIRGGNHDHNPPGTTNVEVVCKA